LRHLQAEVSSSKKNSVGRARSRLTPCQAFVSILNHAHPDKHAINRTDNVDKVIELLGKIHEALERLEDLDLPEFQSFVFPD
jgi:hypothetical protein